MKRLVAFASALVLAMTGCASSVQNTMDSPTHVGVAPSPTSVHSYRCESGQAIAATYPSPDSATVKYKARNHHMKIAASGSGARYVGDDLEWWTKASGARSDGTLLRHKSDGTSGEILERCTEF